jgi:carbamoyl-phosphate synthase large subunit
MLLKATIRNKAVNKSSFNILFTCIGRRVSLLNCFRAAARELKIKAAVLGTDRTDISPALRICDEGYVVKSVTHRNYIDQLLTIVRAKKIKLVVPTVDLDLRVLAHNKSKFNKLGCCVLVSDEKVIDICQDKRKTYRFLVKNGFDTPVTTSVAAALSKKRFMFPMFVKPWDGYASRGNAVVKSRAELRFYAKKVPNPICQEFVHGAEHTCDVFVDFDMKVRCVVPRKRIEVRAGEVSKGRTVKNSRIIHKAALLVEKLGAGPGVITIQLFLNKNGMVKFIEVNPRFGGGVPLAIKAGANFPKWIIQQMLGKNPRIMFGGFKDGLTMLRYDAEVWMPTSR